jgi:hypothetical protein
VEKSLNLIVDGPSNHVVVGDVVSLTQWCTGWCDLLLLPWVFFFLPWLLFLTFFLSICFFVILTFHFFFYFLNFFLKINIKENKNKSIVRQEMENLRKLTYTIPLFFTSILRSYYWTHAMVWGGKPVDLCWLMGSAVHESFWLFLVLMLVWWVVWWLGCWGVINQRDSGDDGCDSGSSSTMMVLNPTCGWLPLLYWFDM